MSYEVKLAANEYLYDKPNSLTLNIYSDGVPVQPTSVTISVWDPGKVNKLDEVSATISGTTPYTCTYSAASTVFNNYTEDWRLMATFVVSGQTHYSSFFFDVVKHLIYNDVIDSDLTKLHPNLLNNKHSGITNYSGFINEAFRQIKIDIKAFGDRPTLMLDGSQVHDLIIHKALELIFFEFSNNEADIWFTRYREKQSDYKASLSNCRIKYDRDQDEAADGIEARYHDVRLRR